MNKLSYPNPYTKMHFFTSTCSKYSYLNVLRKYTTIQTEHMCEKCSICLEKFNMSTMIKQPKCIQQIHIVQKQCIQYVLQSQYVNIQNHNTKYSIYATWSYPICVMWYTKQYDIQDSKSSSCLWFCTIDTESRNFGFFIIESESYWAEILEMN